MKKLIVTVALFLLMPAFVWAQDTDHKPRVLGSVFIGAGSHQMGITTGFGGEGYIYKGLGVGAEIGTAGFTTSTNGNRNIIGVGSADLFYHFFPKNIQRSAAPFVAGGYTLFFGQDVEAYTGSVGPLTGFPPVGARLTGNIAHGFNVGGGVDIFAAKHVGARFDLRYYAHGGHILWASFPNEAQLSFVVFRIGLTFR